jgi:molybdenum cofactor cytidylyltransferase
MDKNQFAVLLLAAGGATRMGQPKQLLVWKGKTLLEHQLSLAQSINRQTLVVLGSGYHQMLPVVQTLESPWVYNRQWSQGMSSSLKLGVNQAMELYPEIQGLLIMLVDQPLIEESHYRSLIPADLNKAAATEYPHGPGVPAYLPLDLFPEIDSIEGDKGARDLFNNLKDSLTLVACKQSLIDIDTEQDWQKFLSENG